MIVTLLGTGSPLPDAQRAGPATLVQAGGLNLLVDCGRGVSMRLAAAGIPGFRKMLGRVADVAPLRRNVTLEDVGNAAAFLCSDLAAGVTGVPATVVSAIFFVAASKR